MLFAPLLLNVIWKTMLIFLSKAHKIAQCIIEWPKKIEFEIYKDLFIASFPQ